MSGEKRNHFTGAEKIRILKEHLVEGKAVSDVCDQHGVNPTVFYRWQQELFERGATVFERKGGNGSSRLEDKIEGLEAKLSRKNEVLSELMEEHVALKKSLGET
jgi:transposase